MTVNTVQRWFIAATTRTPTRTPTRTGNDTDMAGSGPEAEQELEGGVANLHVATIF